MESDIELPDVDVAWGEGGGSAKNSLVVGEWLLPLATIGWLLLLGMACTCGQAGPRWWVAGAVGAAWGSCFVAATILARSAATGRGFLAAGANTVLTIVWLEGSTDVDRATAIFCTSIFLAVGWGVGRCRAFASRSDVAARPGGQFRWTLADLAVTTTLVAMTMVSVRLHAESPDYQAGWAAAWRNGANGWGPLHVWVALVATMAGAISCWAAYRIVWEDRWSTSRGMMLVFSMLGVLGLLVVTGLFRPLGTPFWRWCLAGPGQCLAAQTSLVLIGCGLDRLRECLRRSPSAERCLLS
ncbi:MAG: hypothetical protein KatS3mg111_2174 [Pirellulaceae bacterium]|nr:MAG: hypothetical protein KatS3mg111_2174 [Pirellulaceae bacterium]